MVDQCFGWRIAMVKVGFIVEGDSEMVFMKKNTAFHQLLENLNIEIVAKVDGKGGQLFNPRLINGLKKICKDAGAEHIIILTDLDELNSFQEKKDKIDTTDVSEVVISRKSFEAWFLADTNCIRSAIENNNYYCELPEEIANPFLEIKNLSIQNRNGRGYSSKPLLSKRMSDLGFNIEIAAQHPNCPSARYFIDKLQQIAQ